MRRTALWFVVSLVFCTAIFMAKCALGWAGIHGPIGTGTVGVVILGLGLAANRRLGKEAE